MFLFFLQTNNQPLIGFCTMRWAQKVLFLNLDLSKDPGENLFCFSFYSKEAFLGGKTLEKTLEYLRKTLENPELSKFKHMQYATHRTETKNPKPPPKKKKQTKKQKQNQSKNKRNKTLNPKRNPFKKSII